MKKIVIIGNGDYAHMMKTYVETTLFGQVLAYVADKEYIADPQIDKIDVITFEDFFGNYSCHEVSLVMGVGYTAMGNVRRDLFVRCKEQGYKFENYIHPSAILASDVILGEGNNILEGVILEAGVSVGNANLFFGGCVIGHNTCIGDYNTCSIKAVTAGNVIIKNHCFLGVASAVKDRVTLNDYVLIGAMACGFCNMDKYSVVVPAKSEILRDRKSVDCL